MISADRPTPIAVESSMDTGAFVQSPRTKQESIPQRSERQRMTQPGKELKVWADSNQYDREPIPKDQRKKIKVTLINATPDPLGSLVVLNGIYSGQVIRGLNDPRVTNVARLQAFQDLTATVLNGPMEAIKLHFLVEGLTRSATHQGVRSRGAFFAQESLRFAVPSGDWREEIPLPPHLSSTNGGETLGAESSTLEWQRNVWDEALKTLQESYDHLVNSGMPAEEARGLIPHQMPTRYHWVVDLRTLLNEAGKRTCTQAEFHWREIFAQVAVALREYGYRDVEVTDHRGDLNHLVKDDAWQFSVIADKLRPNCFQTGSCGFMAQFDRGCKIRDRVEAFSRNGIGPDNWDEPAPDTADMIDSGHTNAETIHPIRNWEWAADPSAARE